MASAVSVNSTAPEMPKPALFDNIKSCFLHLSILIMEKVPRLTAKDYTFDPTIYIPHIGQR